MFDWGLIADYTDTPEKIKKGWQWLCNAQSEKVIDDKKIVSAQDKKKVLFDSGYLHI